MDGTARRRSGSFRQDDDEDVQFLTPHYGNDPGGPEPLDFSKLDLHLEGDDKEDYDEDQEERDQELIISRGRSRSRSVHEYDDNNASVLPDTVPKHKAMSAEEVQELEKKKHAEKGNGNATPAAPVDRTGPLQHREVVALQKGLEEATHTFTKGNSREDEEERMAADAEKRKRMLAASNHLPTSKDAEPNRRVKLLLLGDSGVGKSSLIMRWTLDSFSPSLTSTVGVNFKSKKINYSGELIQVQVWDTAGQENFHKITTSYYKGAQGIMLVYDVADQKSLDNVEYWIKNIKAHASDSVQVVLVGNKIDLRQVIDSNTGALMKCVDTERGKEIAKKFSVPFFEASAKDSSHVDEAFLTLVHQIIEMSTPKHHSAVRASLQGGVERKNLDIRSSVGNSNNSGSQSPPNHSLNKDNNFNNANKAGDNSAAGGNKESKMLKSLGLKKNSASTPDKANVANSNNNGNGATATAGNGEDKEKCIIS